MTAPSLNTIEAAIQSLQARHPKPRDCKQELASHVEQLRHLIAAGLALLRDVLQASPAKPKKVAQPKQAMPSPLEAPNTGTLQRDQPVADTE